MNAVRLERQGPPEVLHTVECPEPRPAPSEVVVEVAAAGVNFIDVYLRNGLYPLDLPSGIGREGAGHVVAVGTAVTDRTVGDRVAFCDATGAYAELVAIDASRTVVVPDTLDLDLAAALLVQGMTAHYLTHDTYPLRAGDTALVYAAAGGTGGLLVQLAHRAGARVLACTSTDEKAARARRLGADEVIRYRDEEIAPRVRELTDGRGVDVAYDSVGRDTFDASLASLRPRGLLALYGQSSGTVGPVDLQLLARHGALFVTRPTLLPYVATAEELTRRAAAVFSLVIEGALDVMIHGRYPLADAARAHRDLESATTTGKLLLVP